MHVRTKPCSRCHGTGIESDPCCGHVTVLKWPCPSACCSHAPDVPQDKDNVYPLESPEYNAWLEQKAQKHER